MAYLDEENLKYIWDKTKKLVVEHTQDTCREVIEARGTDKTLKDRLDRMEAQKGARKEIVDYTPTWNELSPAGLVNVETPEIKAVTGTLTTYTLEGE